MITPQEKEILWILDLIAQQEEDGFQTLLAPIHIVAQEKIVCRRREPTHFKQSDKVRILPMNVTNDLDGRRKLDKRGLAEENLSCCLAYGSNLCVFQTE